MSSIERIVARIAQAVSIYFSAGAFVWALIDERKPDPDDLRKLGVDPRAYLSMGHG